MVKAQGLILPHGKTTARQAYLKTPVYLIFTLLSPSSSLSHLSTGRQAALSSLRNANKCDLTVGASPLATCAVQMLRSLDARLGCMQNDTTYLTKASGVVIPPRSLPMTHSFHSTLYSLFSPLPGGVLQRDVVFRLSRLIVCALRVV